MERCVCGADLWLGACPDCFPRAMDEMVKLARAILGLDLLDGIAPSELTRDLFFLAHDVAIDRVAA